MVDEKIKKKAEKVADDLRAIDPEVLDAFFESLIRHSYAARLDAHHSRRNSVIDEQTCAKTDLIVLSGIDKTDNTGKAKLLIDRLLCRVRCEGIPLNRVLVMAREPIFVATPILSAPAFATVRTSSTERLGEAFDRDDNPLGGRGIENVVVEIATWNHDGTPRPKTEFSWICTIEAARGRTHGPRDPE